MLSERQGQGMVHHVRQILDILNHLADKGSHVLVTISILNERMGHTEQAFLSFREEFHQT